MEEADADAAGGLAGACTGAVGPGAKARAAGFAAGSGLAFLAAAEFVSASGKSLAFRLADGGCGPGFGTEALAKPAAGGRGGTGPVAATGRGGTGPVAATGLGIGGLTGWPGGAVFGAGLMAPFGAGRGVAICPAATPGSGGLCIGGLGIGSLGPEGPIGGRGGRIPGIGRGPAAAPGGADPGGIGRPGTGPIGVPGAPGIGLGNPGGPGLPKLHSLGLWIPGPISGFIVPAHSGNGSLVGGGLYDGTGLIGAKGN